MFPREAPQNYSAEYKCYSVSMMPGQERQDVEQGGKSMSCFLGKVFLVYYINCYYLNMTENLLCMVVFRMLRYNLLVLCQLMGH